MQEIERKFLVDPVKWRPASPGVRIMQGYLSVDPERVVRVRIAGQKSYLTIKGKTEGISRTELEYKIPLNEAKILLQMCLDAPVIKMRYRENIDGKIWEVDVFEGDNRGLLVAEIELTNENQEVNLPFWILNEVSGDHRYYNAWLSKHPYAGWQS